MNLCEWCGKLKRRYSHHIIPRWCGGKEEDIIEVCQGCHVKLERLFDNFIKWGSFCKKKWKNMEKERQRNRENFCYKNLFSGTGIFIPYLDIIIELRYNKKTERFVITTKYRYKSKAFLTKLAECVRITDFELTQSLPLELLKLREKIRAANF